MIDRQINFHALNLNGNRELAMLVKLFTVGLMSANCFLVGDKEAGEAVVIDPGFDAESEAEKIFSEIMRIELRVKFIVNTHGHPDHVGGNRVVKEFCGAPILIHEQDFSLLSNPPADRRLRDGDLIEVGDMKLKVVHSPGHSKGSVILVGSDEVFSGDTLFAGSIGRFDLPGGSLDDLVNSLKSKVLTLPDHFRVYPGHGPVTTIGEERRSNPFLQNFDWTAFG